MQYGIVIEAVDQYVFGHKIFAIKASRSVSGFAVSGVLKGVGEY